MATFFKVCETNSTNETYIQVEKIEYVTKLTKANDGSVTYVLTFSSPEHDLVVTEDAGIRLLKFIKPQA